LSPPTGISLLGGQTSWSLDIGALLPPLADGTYTISLTDGTATGAAILKGQTIVIDTAAPTVFTIATSGTGITGGAGDLNAGKLVTFTVNFSEAVTVAGGTPTLAAKQRSVCIIYERFWHETPSRSATRWVLARILLICGSMP